MLRSGVVRSVLVVLLAVGLARPGAAQYTTIPFTSGPIPLCDTSTFTANVSGIGMLSPAGSWDPWTYWINSLTINITSDHPQTLQIFLTSPSGTELLLSEFNGAGGQNYTNTNFTYWGDPSITTGTAPFTGNWTPQGGSFSAFDYEWADGIWTITVIDTSCVNGGSGQGGNWTPGWFDGSGGTGGFAIGFNPGPPPCWGGIPSDMIYICPGQTVDLLGYYMSSNPGYNYTFTGPDWAPVPDPSSVTTPGQYSINASDPWDGCWYMATYDVYLLTPASLGPDQVVDQCSGAGTVDLTLLFTLSGTTPEWSFNGVPIAVATAAAANEPGVYQLIAQSGGSCNDTALVTLNITAVPVLGADQSISICPGSNVDLTTLYDTGGLPWDWTFGGSAFATPTAASDAGVYTLTVTTTAGCTDMANVTLAVEALPSLGADQSLDLCGNTSLDLTALYTTTGLTASWTLSDVPVADPGSVSSAGTYQLVASNGSACTDTAFVSVNVVAAPALGADAMAAACEGNTVDLTGFFSTTGLSATWTLSGSAVPDPTSVGTSGLYALVAMAASGCSDTAQVDVTVSTNPVLGPDQSLTECDGTVVDLTALYATGANTTAWTESGVPVAAPASITSGGIYTLTATSGAGCSTTAVVTLELDPAPALGADQSSSICASSTFDLTTLYSTTGLTEAWTLNGAAVADPMAVAVTGEYQLVVTNGAGCTDTAVVALVVSPNPSLGADLWFSLCPWQTVDLSAVFPVAGLNAVYALGGQPVGDPTGVSDPGTYVVTVTDANGCTDEAMASVSSVECMCVADFTHDAWCMQEPAQFTLLADSAVLAAHWEFSGAATGSTDIDPVMRFTSEGDVLVTLEATLSCGVVEVERTIHVQDCSDSCTVWIPSAFTPDNNGRNETWTWYGACEPEDFSMMIYSRWGELIFASNDPLSSWDGTYHGALSPPGVYAYRVGYRLPYQKRKEVRGSITLVR
jgi:gliding motility-associated-like protein